MTKTVAAGAYTLLMRIIWVDLCFAINFAADYLICLLSMRLCSVPLRRGRCALAAAFGALWAVAAAAGLSFFSSPAGKLLGAAALLALSAALSGAVWALSLRSGGAPVFSPRLLVFGFSLFWALFEFPLRGVLQKREREILTVELSFLGRSASFRALVDTGNSLCDPVSGAHVMVVSPAALRAVLGDLYPLFLLPDAAETLSAASCLDALRGKLRLVPYSAVGARGLLVAFRPDSLTVGGEERKDLLVALSPSASGEGHEGVL